MSAVPAIELNDGNHIPQLGFGVFQIEPERTASAVKDALEIGYRHIDTAEMYGNEKEVGQGVRNAGLDRGDVFITSKLNNGFHKPDDARRAFDNTLRVLESDYVDLFLIHWPLPTLYGGDFVSTWHVLEEFARDGRARSIGVSNFQPAHLDRWRRNRAPYLRSTRLRFIRTLQTKQCAPTELSMASRPRPGRRSLRERCSTTPLSSALPTPSAEHRHRLCCAGTSSAATSSSRNQCRRIGCGPISNCSTSSLAAPIWTRSPPSTEANPGEPALTPTSSTTSPTSRRSPL
jgi:hypothetical protein